MGDPELASLAAVHDEAVAGRLPGRTILTPDLRNPGPASWLLIGTAATESVQVLPFSAAAQTLLHARHGG